MTYKKNILKQKYNCRLSTLPQTNDISNLGLYDANDIISILVSSFIST